MLYWCDARTDKIERINLETGENREVVLANNNMDMFSVSVFESYIYWSDRSDDPPTPPPPSILHCDSRVSSAVLILGFFPSAYMQNARQRLYQERE